jgi:cob(I)alamin adenosyltransferase
MLARIQNDLFDLGADLCRPDDIDGALRIVSAQVERLEQEIDAMNLKLAPLDSFVLPGGSAASAALHVARTVVRRAERLSVALASESDVNPLVIQYLNRLSDHLFQLARINNDGGAGDVLWTPGATR